MNSTSGSFILGAWPCVNRLLSNCHWGLLSVLFGITQTSNLQIYQIIQIKVPGSVCDLSGPVGSQMPSLGHSGSAGQQTDRQTEIPSGDSMRSGHLKNLHQNRKLLLVCEHWLALKWTRFPLFMESHKARRF